MGAAERKSYKIQIIVALVGVAGVSGAIAISIFREPDRGPERPEAATEEPVKAVLLSKPGDVATNSIGMKLVYVPAGSFMMGSSDSAAQLAKEYDEEESVFADEFPQHQVRISEGFWMGQTEVTQGQYTAVMHSQPWSRYPLVQKSANNPAVWVTWEQAAAFCRRLSQREGKTYRLPAEAEWEYACRAGTTTRFSFGDSDLSIGDYAWCRSNAFEGGQKYAHPVGQKKPNPWGLYDMHGNVFEWCGDYYDEDYYSNSPSIDPKGPLSEAPRSRSLRGGSWMFLEEFLRCSDRYESGSINRCNFVGFRVVGCQLEPDVEPDRGPKRPEVAPVEPVEAALLPGTSDAVTNSVGMKLVYIPAGSFMMGSGDSASQLAKEYAVDGVTFADEFPQHQVRISEGFRMGQTEVTQGQYKSVMNAEPWYGMEYVEESANNPAVWVSWEDAAAFCRKLSRQEGKTYRLPTEAEWEYACRAGTTTQFGFGDDDSSLGDYAWFNGNAFGVGEKYAHPVGQKKPNPWGMYDMHGNVFEWCSDYYDKDYYSNSPSVDPKGPLSAARRSRPLRGGSWMNLGYLLRCSERGWQNAFNRESFVVGFRVVQSQSGPQVEPDEEPERAEAAAEEPVEAALRPKPGYAETNSVGMKLVYIPAGSFMMGSSSSAAQLAKEYDEEESDFADEFPQHQVRISEGFWMGQTEVTQGQYESVMNVAPWRGTRGVKESANNPAVYVSWHNAMEFCRTLSRQEGKTYRLPTEAQWEYACRAGTTTRFSFGDSDSSLGDYAWFDGNTYDVNQKYAHPVGLKKPNPWALYDMHGNALEWCSDYYDQDYYSNSPSVDPKGPARGTRRCFRGGSWHPVEDLLHCSYRIGGGPGIRIHFVGFRVVRSQP